MTGGLSVTHHPSVDVGGHNNILFILGAVGIAHKLVLTVGFTYNHLH